MLPPTLVVLFVFSLLPLRWLAWESWFGDVTRTLVAPIMNAAAAFSHAVRPPVRSDPDSRATAELRADRDAALFQLAQERQENERLRARITDLQRGVELVQDPSLKFVSATVIGRDADLSRQVLHIRAGSSQNVVSGSVAVVDGAQLLGRVQSVGPKVSSIQLVTDSAAGRVRGLVMVEGAQAQGGVECDLAPAGDGTLRGRLAAPEPRAGEQPPDVKVGQLVRLYDATWPKNAQMLELGTIESIDANPEQPIRRIVTVRPRFDLARASEVLLRVTGESEGDAPSREGGR